jgi:hypothetical protein
MSELRKITLNLFADDVEFFQDRFGYGWSVELRRIMRREVRNYQKLDKEFSTEKELQNDT